MNRLDEIVVFNRLDAEQIRQIVDIQLRRFADRLARRESVARADRPREGLPRRARLGSAVRRPPAEARDPEEPGGSRWPERPRRRIPPGTRIVVDRGLDGDLTFAARMQN